MKQEESKEIIKGVKGFNKDLKCCDFQFKEGETFEHEGEVKACEKGFHFCENPIDVFGYYAPGTSTYHEVTGEGKTHRDGEDSKVAVSKIHIGAKIELNAIVKATVNFIFDRVKWKDAPATNTGDYSAATNTGDYSAATNTGYKSAATNTGYKSAATNTGDYSAATNTGYNSAATNTGDYSAATNTGNNSAATNTGYKSAATNTGNNSAATNTGDYSAATNTGYKSAATNTGYKSAATNTGNYSAATNTGYKSAATNTGDYSAATNTGNNSAATNTGDYSEVEAAGKGAVALGIGYESKAKGVIGGWLVLAECHQINGETFILDMKTAMVDGNKIKADTFYKLKKGKFILAD